MFFDIGANIGKWSLSNLNNSPKIIAVEAAPKTFHELTMNTREYSNIICLNFAVCNTEKEYIEFYECVCDTLSTLNKDWLESEKSRFYNYPYNTIKCKTISIDKLIEIYGIPDLIKVDVEGGEFYCISSLTQKVNSLCFEWAAETNDVTIKCLDYLVSIGYNEFSTQFEDDYLYRPTIYTDINSIKNSINKAIPKKDWGMIWAK